MGGIKNLRSKPGIFFPITKKIDLQIFHRIAIFRFHLIQLKHSEARRSGSHDVDSYLRSLEDLMKKYQHSEILVCVLCVEERTITTFLLHFKIITVLLWFNSPKMDPLLMKVERYEYKPCIYPCWSVLIYCRQSDKFIRIWILIWFRCASEQIISGEK